MAVSQSAEAAGAVRTLDFSQPTKFTTELRRRIAAGLGQSCETMSAALSAQLKSDVTVELGELDQSTWAAARAGLVTDAVAVGVQAEEAVRSMLLNVEQAVILQALECMLGGKAAQAPAERHLSEIDWALAKGVLDTVVGELASAWSELGGPGLRRGELDLEGDAGIAVAAGEPALTATFRTSVDGCDGAMWLLLPWSAVAPLAEGADAGAEHGVGGQAAAGLREGLAVAQVLLRAEVGSVQMPIEQMLAIEPGALVELHERAVSGVRLFAEEVSVGRGRPGRSGTRKAIKLEEADEHPIRAARYAKLGRAELDRARAHALGEDERSRSPSILRSIFVRVWAELGRTHIALGGAAELAPGAVVELDQTAEQPVELFANGLCFASGSLVVTADGGWGVAVEHIM
jgi:flagellar motor switch protein FliM